ncbi:MORN repeat-containing protein [Strigomonas culicis]|uniref:MORN repeat-containing protein n=1 Tax=Strigomonas culicis TaxID=28005 RepID=S9UKP3_9TRYP|nr:MORN repeat-containing protein [Strigomonas culicis]|eukprot:EPY15226.1 MORN repeat-containing protein [Strigomonas culicis]
MTATLRARAEALAAAEASRQCNAFLEQQAQLEEEVADAREAERRVDARVDEGVLAALRRATAPPATGEARATPAAAPVRPLSVRLEEDATSPFLTQREVRQLAQHAPAPLEPVDANAAPAGKPRKGSLAYSDAYVYVGDLVHLPGRRRGGGADRQAELLRWRREGSGTMYHDGPAGSSYYRGGWRTDRPHGTGALSLPHTAVEGTWEAGELTGPAVLRTPHLSGAVEFAQGAVDGPAALDLDNGARYVGVVRPDGDVSAAPGLFRLASGDHVEWLRSSAGAGRGPASPERRVGCGVCRVRFTNGDVYVGEVAAFAMHGRGHYVFATGGEYMGGFTHGFMTGTGIYTFENGNLYKGQLYKGLYHGRGVYVQRGEYSYEGEWVHGTMHGHGLLRFANGDVWEGEFEQDRRVRGSYVKVVAPLVMP